MISKHVGDIIYDIKEYISLEYVLLCLYNRHVSILKSCLWIALVFSNEVILSPRSQVHFASWFNDAGRNSVESDTVPYCWLQRGHQKYRWQGAINTSLLYTDGRELFKTAVLSSKGAYIRCLFSKQLSLKESIFNGVKALSL